MLQIYKYTRQKILVNVFKAFIRLFNTAMILILWRFCCRWLHITTLLLWSLLPSSHSPEISLLALWRSHWKAADAQGSCWSSYWERRESPGFPTNQAVQQVLHICGFDRMYDVPGTIRFEA